MPEINAAIVVRSRIPVLRPQTAARAMLRTFAERGVTAAFGIPGGLISPIFDALVDVPEIRLITTRHETIAAFAAMGHAIATGTPALLLTTSGPGITNAITGISSAFAEEIPLIAISGEVPRSSMSRGAFQDSSTDSMDIVAMLRTVTRWSTRIESGKSAKGTAEHAVRMATSATPGPVFISLPVDVGNTTVGAVPPARFALPRASTGLQPDPLAIRDVARALARARRPLIVAGNGAREAAADLLVLAERLAIPVVTTPHGKGVFPEGHSLHLGGIGFGGHPSASAYMQSGVDVLVVVGSRLGDFATNGWSIALTGSEASVQIDRDARLIGRNHHVTLGIVADAGLALRGILTSLPEGLSRPLRELTGTHYLHPEHSTSDATPLKPARVIRELQEAFPDAFWTSDIGEHCAHAVHYLMADGPDSFRSLVGMGSMGSGIGVAIGVRQTRKDRPVVCICGDGGFAMHAGDLLTCVEFGIDVVFVIMNDGRWNMVDHGFQAVYGRAPDGLPRAVADLAAVARGFGAIGEVIDTPEALDPMRLRELSGRGRPVVLDVRIDASESLSVGSRSVSVKKSAFGGAL